MRVMLLLLMGLAPVACERSSAPSSTGSPAKAGSDIAGLQADSATAPAALKETRIVFEIDGVEHGVTVEVVQTPAKIQRGLMHRQHMAPDRGMLFVFASDRVRSFWMKNTLIPLDMLFVTKDWQVAGIVRDTEPLSLESRSVGIATRYVLELNGGWTAAHGVDAGAKLRVENLPAIENPPL